MNRNEQPAQALGARWNGILALVVTAAAWASLAAGAPTTNPSQTLHGRWILNPEKSDDPMAKLRDARGSGGPEMGGRPGGAGGRGGGRNGAGRRAGGEPPGGPRGEEGPGRGGMRTALADLAPAETLLITGTDQRLVLEGGRRGTHEIHTVPCPANSPRTAASVAWPGRWEKEALVVEREGSNGTIVRESYAVVDGGRRLEIRTRVEPADRSEAGQRPRSEFEFKRVYDRVDAGPAGGR
jgi:hypothetical protein